MPPTYQQSNRPMTVTTPLGPDVLLLVGFSGHEAISQLFSFELDLAAEDQTKVVFEKLLGHKVTVNLTVQGGQKRHFSGICTSLTQGMRGIDHTAFQMEVSPHLWLLTLRSRSRIFQNESVPEILKKVLDIPDVVYELDGHFDPRTYCVQYRETDFHFASRLMEEEGIYYYFKHKAESHQMVVSNKAGFPELQPAELIWQQAAGTTVQEERINRWQKQQQLRSLKVTLRDYHFQMPQKSLEAVQEIQDDVKVGKVTHKLRIGEAEHLELYDWPGEYAHRFDAIDRGGADRPDELQKLLADNERTAKIRMEQEAAQAIAIQGASRYRHLVSGHTFTLKEQVVVPYDGSSSHDGKYVLTSVNHTGRMSGSYRSGDLQEVLYDNSFTCIPAALQYRPQRTTPKPVVMGPQTAVVVGPKGEKIFTDKYGRVKVQFHWDREGKRDAGSSCWVRVTQPWADKGFGMICVPRAGQEVVVTFMDGDPDRPQALGGAYNADNPPPFKLPENRMFTALKTNSVLGNPAQNFSGLAFDDTPQQEHVALYAEKDMMVNAEHNHTHNVGNYHYSRIGSMSLTKVGSLPGAGGAGGGSGGGGGNGATGTTTESDTVQSGLITSIGEPQRWVTSPTAMPLFGFGGTTIYGINSQDTCGFMHQITFGQATQIAFDPWNSWGFLKKVWQGKELTDPAFPQVPFFGNQQLYWGTNYQSVYGPNVSYSYAPALNLTGKPGPLQQVMATLVPAVCIAYEVAYAFIGGDKKDLSGIVALSFSGLLITLNAILLEAQNMDYKITQTAHTAAMATATANLESAFIAAASSMSGKAQAEFARNELATLASDMKGAAQLPITSPTHSVSFMDGDSIISARNCHQFAWQPLVDSDGKPNPNSTSSIYINAYGQAGKGGSAIIHASAQMTLTSGGAYVGLENQQDVSGNITMKCGPQGNITLTRAMPIVPGTTQSIQMTPPSIQVQGGAGMVTLSAGGPSPAGASILLQPYGFISLTVPGWYLSVSQAGIMMGSQDEQNMIWISKQGIVINATTFFVNSKLVSHT